VSDWKGTKEMGAEKWGCNERGESVAGCSKVKQTPGMDACLHAACLAVHNWGGGERKCCTRAVACCLPAFPASPATLFAPPPCPPYALPAGDAWRETWREAIAFDEANNQPFVERSAHKWANNLQVGGGGVMWPGLLGWQLNWPLGWLLPPACLQLPD
jgi:hypothetical protein